MIKYFSVENFMNFNESVSLDFSDVRNYSFNTNCIKNNLIKNSIIYGKNSSGKSNLGYAFFDIMYHLVDQNRGLGQYTNYLNVDSLKKFATFKYIFVLDGDEIIYKYKKEDVTKLIYEELIINQELMYKYDFINHHGDFKGVKDKITETLNFNENIDISIVKYIGNNSLLSDSSPIKKLLKYVSNMIWFRSIGSYHQYVGNELGETTITKYLVNKNLIKEFECFLKKCGIDEELVIKKDPSGTDIIYFNKNKLLPFASSASSGTIALAMFYVWFNQVINLSFIWIDEFDAFYHYELSENIVKMLENQSNCQTVLSSHNTNLLSNRIMRPDTYFILSKGKLTSLCNATDRELREGHNLEKLYMNGEFDSEENISDC